MACELATARLDRGGEHIDLGDKVLGEGGRKEQSGGHQAVVVKRMRSGLFGGSI